jgi:hypothetical protein
VSCKDDRDNRYKESVPMPTQRVLLVANQTATDAARLEADLGEPAWVLGARAGLTSGAGD